MYRYGPKSSFSQPNLLEYSSLSLSLSTRSYVEVEIDTYVYLGTCRYQEAAMSFDRERSDVTWKHFD